ncbi:MAG TPA: ABC transporter permease [Spirochaetia bacterium]|nr:ABC transporter permease [Spirochaetia bacterium]
MQIRIVTLLALLGVWELLSRIGVISQFALPAPTRIAETLYTLGTVGFPNGINVFVHMKATIIRIIEGYVLGSITAVPLGLLIGRLPLLERSVNPVVTFARSIATISLLPLAIAWFGVGELARVLLITYAVFWAVLTNTIEGAKSVDRDYLNVARMFGTSRARLFFRVIFPASLPRIFSGLKIGLGLAFMVIIGVEMIGTIVGLGALIEQGQQFYRTDIAIAGTVLIGIFGLVISLLLDLAERILMPWASGLQEVKR